MFNDELIGRAIERVRTRDLTSDYAHAPLAPMLDRMQAQLTAANVRRVWDHPSYRQVVAAMAAVGLPSETDNGVLNHALRDPLRFVMAIWALGLSLTPGGLTYARFNGMLQTVQAGSRTLTYALFGYLRFLGYIEPAPGGEDRRERRFQPSALLRRALRDHIARGLQGIAAIDPVAGEIGQRVSTEDRVFDEVARQCSDGMLATAMVERYARPSPLNKLNRRRSGSAMLWALLQAAPEVEPWPTAEPFAISVADLARRSGVSRPHYMRMLRDGEAAGLLVLEPNGKVRLSPELREQMNGLIAVNVITFGVTAQIVLEALGRQQAA
ncbi:hypothetical protein GVN21_06120 [Caulobacter sp. SLTY]|uniref:hypothetical protein n=1 Tax=Caulobacter sp. SLTY TaxID=2683262 RepID=UPI0014128FB9|nr:hypothetical protein [Caulobacter sp. SLTY]NBB14939.1 hypothetical protein [Caulobacter sp. SLTY]